MDVSTLQESLTPFIENFQAQTKERGGVHLFRKAIALLQALEVQRFALFDKELGHYNSFSQRSGSRGGSGNVGGDCQLLIAKIVGLLKEAKRTMRRNDRENDQVALATQLYVDLAKLAFLFNGDGVNKRPTFRNGAYYTFTGEQRPLDPLLDRLKIRALSFVRPLHSTSTSPEWSVYAAESDWADIKLELDWDEFVAPPKPFYQQ